MEYLGDLSLICKHGTYVSYVRTQNAQMAKGNLYLLDYKAKKKKILLLVPHSLQAAHTIL